MLRENLRLWAVELAKTSGNNYKVVRTGEPISSSFDPSATEISSIEFLVEQDIKVVKRRKKPIIKGTEIERYFQAAKQK